jgi:rhodanese-related sulfurtransferase
VGYLQDGMQALATRADLVQSIDRVTATALAEDLKSDDPPLVLDVRNPGERVQKFIAGSKHVPLAQLGRQLDDLPQDHRIVIHCAGGYRSAIAASLLQRHGITAVEDLVGGLAAWEKSGLPVVSTS